MDIWKYYGITHSDHVICNPLDIEKYDAMIALLGLSAGSRVLDIACGKGEFLLRMAEQHSITGVGVDISSWFIKEALKNQAERCSGENLSFKEMNAADYSPGKGDDFDVVSCLGASWIYNGHDGTLKALASMTKPGGWVLSGEPFWIKDPHPEYLKSMGEEKEAFGTHFENSVAGKHHGLELYYTMCSSLDDWDWYEGLQWQAAENYASANPDDPDNAELLEKVRKTKNEYLRWGRDCLGWAVYMFRKK